MNDFVFAVACTLTLLAGAAVFALIGHRNGFW